MSDSDWTIGRAAAALLAAEDARADREPLTAEWEGLTPARRTRCRQTLRRRLGRGQQLVGVKLGLTSRAKQRRMNVSAPLTAWLTDAMVLPAGVPVPQTGLSIRAPNRRSCSLCASGWPPGRHRGDRAGRGGAVYGGVEVIDSRYRDFRFTLADVVADNASSGCFVTGPVGLPPTAGPGAGGVLAGGGRADHHSATGAAVQGIRPRRSRWPPTTWPSRSRDRARLDRAHRRHDRRRARAGRVKLAAHFTHLGSVQLSGG